MTHEQLVDVMATTKVTAKASQKEKTLTEKKQVAAVVADWEQTCQNIAAREEEYQTRLAKIIVEQSERERKESGNFIERSVS